MAVTIRDVAAAAEVSVATVSRIASGSDYPVGARTREKVLAVIEAMGYRPNQSATDLSRQDTRLVGVVAPDMANQYYSEVTRGLEDVANEASYQVLFCSTDRERDRAQAYIEVLLRRRVAALIIVGGGQEIGLSAAEASAYGTQVVMIGRTSNEFPTVQPNGSSAGVQMAEHLLELGHREFGFIAGSRGSTATRQRQTGLSRALAAAGAPAPQIERGNYTEAGGYQAARTILTSAKQPSALLAANDRMAIGAMAAANDLGLDVPGDVALAGFDNTPISAYVRPALTTFALRSTDLGAEAMRMILDREEGDDRAHHRKVDGSIVIRQSCGSPRRPGQPMA